MISITFPGNLWQQVNSNGREIKEMNRWILGTFGADSRPGEFRPLAFLNGRASSFSSPPRPRRYFRMDRRRIKEGALDGLRTAMQVDPANPIWLEILDDVLPFMLSKKQLMQTGSPSKCRS